MTTAEAEFDTLYPEHAKLKLVSEESQDLGNLIERLSAHGMKICEAHEDRWGAISFDPVSKGIEGILAELYEIDLVKIETEKRAMLDSMRAANARRDAEEAARAE
jgi:hypothetical protein